MSTFGITTTVRTTMSKLRLLPTRRCTTATLLLLAIVAWQQPVAAQGTTLAGSLNGQFGVSASTTQNLSFDYDSDSGQLFTTIEPRLGVSWTLELERYSMRADDFTVFVDVGASDLRPILSPPIRTWRGVVLEDPSIRVRASYQNNQMTAHIYAADETYVVEPIPFAPGQHIVYAGSDSLPQNSRCGVNSTGNGAPPSGPAPAGTGLRIVEIGIDADFQYYQGKSSNVINTVNAIESRMNLVEPLYSAASINVTMELTTIVVRTSNTPYSSTSAGGRLDQFENVWNSSPESSIRHDVAHLFTGQSFEDPPGSNFFTLGIANIGGSFGGVCHSSRSYGLSNEDIGFLSDIERTSLIAHEIGHNFSAEHCNGASGGCKIMCDNLGECNSLTPLGFSPVPAAEISNFATQIGCLHDLLNAQSIPFEDNFEAGAISNARWSYVDGAITSTNGVAEPSGSRALLLDSPGSNPFQFDEIRSNFILLSGSTAPVLEFFTEHRGVESGEELIIDYLNSSLDWVEIDTLVSTGVTQSAFVFHSYVLPVNARHNQFRLRFRTDGNDTGDDWFIDDVYVGEPPVVNLPPMISALFPSAGSNSGGTTVSIAGSNFDPSAMVLWDNTPLPATFISSTELQVVTPAGTGSVNVAVTQGVLSDVLNNAFLYSSAVLRMDDVDGAAGSTVTVAALGTHTFDLEGYSFGVDHDGDLLTVVSVTDIGTAAEGAGFFVPILNTDPGLNGGWFTLGVIVDIQGPTVIPAGFDNILCYVDYEVQGFIPSGLSLALTPDGTLGSPVVPVNFAGPNAVNTVPDTAPGSISVVDGGIFIRGDVNFDQNFNGLTDALYFLNFAFTGGPPPPCESAADADDSGSLQALTDVLYILMFQFNSGSPPPAPYPNAGADPTPDPLTCTP